MIFTLAFFIAGLFAGFLIGVALVYTVLVKAIHNVFEMVHWIFEMLGVEARSVKVNFACAVFWLIYAYHLMPVFGDLNTDTRFDAHWLEVRLKHGFFNHERLKSEGWLPWSFRILKKAHENKHLHDWHWAAVTKAAAHMRMDENGNFPADGASPSSPIAAVGPGASPEAPPSPAPAVSASAAAASAAIPGAAAPEQKPAEPGSIAEELRKTGLPPGTPS